MTTNNPTRVATALVLTVALLALPACRSLGIDDDRAEAAGTGAAIGAIAGAIAGATTARSIIVGGLIGAIAGVAIGEYMSRQQAQIEARTDADVTRISDELMVLTLDTEQLFAPGSAQLTAVGRQRLSNLAEVLNDFPESAIVVRSFTPSAGPAAGDMQLAMQRGEAVRAQLAADGVASARLRTDTFGTDAVATAGVTVAETGHVDILVMANTGAA
jgi:outer membrane protein OmpA-like peptidoglycan-associated protein